MIIPVGIRCIRSASNVCQNPCPSLNTSRANRLINAANRMLRTLGDQNNIRFGNEVICAIPFLLEYYNNRHCYVFLPKGRAVPTRNPSTQTMPGTIPSFIFSSWLIFQFLSFPNPFGIMARKMNPLNTPRMVIAKPTYNTK